MAAERIATGAERSTGLGFVCFLLAAISYGSFGLFIRCLEKDFSVPEQIFLRSAAAALIALPFGALALRRAPQLLLSAKLWMFGIVFPVSIALWTAAVTMGTVRAAVFGLYFGSLVSAPIAAAFFLKEPFVRRTGIAGILALLGAAIFSLGGEQAAKATPILLGGLAGVFQALSLCYRRWLGDVPRPVVILVQSLGGTAFGVLLMLPTGLSLPLAGVFPYAAAFLYGGLVVGVSALLLLGAQNLEITKGNVILATELVWALALAALFLGEQPTMNELLGTTVLLGALAVVSRP